MKKIGRGWLYEVYDLGNGRVRKVVYSDVVRFFVIFFQLGHFSIKDTLGEMKRIKNDALHAYSRLRGLNIIDRSKLGNPVFLDELTYEQDKVSVFKDVLNDLDMNGKKKLINQYVQFIQETWKWGFPDKIFNFSINNGIDADGNMVQIDFSEMSLSKADAESEIQGQSWLTSFSYVTLFPLELRNYYKECMEREITLEKLNLNWKAD